MHESERLERYILEHIEPEDDYLYHLWRKTNVSLLQGRMASGHLQGQLLKMLVQMIRPKRILEIGTYTGYSALSMAAGLGEDGEIISFEINDEMESFTRPLIEHSLFGKKVRFIIGDVLQYLPEFAEKENLSFDLVFIDGDKRQYPAYYELSMRYLNNNGYILADNTLWDGHVADPTYDMDPQTLGIRAFNDLVVADKRTETVIIPLRDGLTLLRKR